MPGINGIETWEQLKTYEESGILPTIIMVTAYGKEVMTCEDINLEMAKMRGFIEHVIKESQFDDRELLSILGDFGMGNSMEKRAALDSAYNRIRDLGKLKRSKDCPKLSQTTAN